MIYWVMNESHINDHWLDIIFSNLILFFPFNLILFCNISELLSYYRLRKQGVMIVNPIFQEIGIINHLSLQLSAYQKMQFQGYIKKQRCVRTPAPQKFQNSKSLFQIYKKAREQSISGFLFWVGMMNLQKLQKQSMYKQFFNKYEFDYRQKNQYDDDEDNNKLRIINATNDDSDSVIRIDWRQRQRFKISEKLIETIIIQDMNANQVENKLIILSQGNLTHQKHFDYFHHLITQDSKLQFRKSINRMFLQGKKIKYICLKRNFIRKQRQLQIKEFEREQIQKRLQFCGFLIFDQWPTLQAMKYLMQIDSYTDKENFTTIFSNRCQNSLIGYDHIFRKSKILYSQNSQERTEEMYQTKRKFQANLHVGNGLIDQSSMLLADISINKFDNKSYGQADFIIRQPQHVNRILYEGFWSLYNTSLIIVCIVLFNFSKVLGQVFKYWIGFQDQFQGKPLSYLLDQIFIMDVLTLIVPVLMLNFYTPTKKLIEKSNRHFFRIQLMIYAITSVAGLVTIYIFEFYQILTQGSSFNSAFIKNRHLNGFQNEYHFLKTRNLNHQLINISHFSAQTNTSNIALTQDSYQRTIYFINISFTLLVILLVDRQTIQRKASNIIFAWINKLYLFCLWIGTIFYYHIPFKSILKESLIIVFFTGIVWTVQFIRNKQQQNYRMKQLQEMKRIQEGFSMIRSSKGYQDEDNDENNRNPTTRKRKSNVFI